MQKASASARNPAEAEGLTKGDLIWVTYHQNNKKTKWPAKV